MGQKPGDWCRSAPQNTLIFTYRRNHMATNTVDELLVGGGVMSATLGTLLSKLNPSLRLTMVERLDHVPHESTDGCNNAGTGHVGYCELNYTPQNDAGEVEIIRAQAIDANIVVSLQMRTAMTTGCVLPPPQNFINPTEL